MQLTLHTDLALRLLIVLTRGDGAPLALTAFAAEQGVSYNHVAKVAQKLVHEGYLASVRGRAGGMKLACDPAQVRIGELVRRMEPGMQMADCAHCALRGGCGLTGLLCDAVDDFLARLDTRTLADVARVTTSA